MIARWLGTVPYGEALAAQRAHRDALVEGHAEEEVWLLEHPPVITTGKREVGDLDPARVRAAGFELFATERGGLATCHEPGQLVGYLLVDARTIGVRRTVEVVERTIAGWLAGKGIAAGPREGYPGVWVGTDKICAVGLHFRQGRTMHGFALNLVNDLRGFRLITPCGITEGGVTSLFRLVGEGAPGPEAAALEIGVEIARALLDAAERPVNRCASEAEGT